MQVSAGVLTPICLPCKCSVTAKRRCKDPGEGATPLFFRTPTAPKGHERSEELGSYYRLMVQSEGDIFRIGVCNRRNLDTGFSLGERGMLVRRRVT